MTESALRAGMHPRSLRAAWLAALLLVVAFLVKAPASVVWALGGALLLSAYDLACRQPGSALIVIAITALIGPICRFALPGGISLHLGDLCLFLVVGITVLRIGPSIPLSLGRRGWLMGALLVLVLIGWGFALDPVASSSTMIGIVELVLVFWLTLLLVRNAVDAQRLLAGWIGAVTLSSVLVIVSYARGEALILGADEAAREHMSQLLLSDTVLFRASFFVAGFIFPLACAIVAASVLVLFPTKLGRLRRSLSALAIAINVLAVALMGNATAAIGVAVGLVTAAVILTVWPRGFRRVVGAGVAGSILGALVVVAITQVMSGAQLQLLLRRAGSNGSFLERLTVWDNVVRYVVSAPKAAMIGLGPDASIRSLNHPLLQDLFRGGGIQQAAVDSGYLYVLLNYGVLAFGIVGLIAIAVIAELFQAAISRRSFLAALLLCLLATWTVMSITQQHGVSKPAFLLMQLLALAECVPRSLAIKGSHHAATRSP